MNPTELLAFLSRGFTLKYDPSQPSASLYNPAGEFARDIPPEVIEKLLSNGLLYISAEEPQRGYALTEKARMLLSYPY